MSGMLRSCSTFLGWISVLAASEFIVTVPLNPNPTEGVRNLPPPVFFMPKHFFQLRRVITQKKPVKCFRGVYTDALLRSKITSKWQTFFLRKTKHIPNKFVTWAYLPIFMKIEPDWATGCPKKAIFGPTFKMNWQFATLTLTLDNVLCNVHVYSRKDQSMLLRQKTFA